MKDSDIFAYAESGDYKNMDFILVCNITDINSIDSGGKTPLFLATDNGHEELVKLLISQQGIDV